MRITADIIDEEIWPDSGACSQAGTNQLSQEVIEQLEADLKRCTQRLDAYANSARSPANEFSSNSTQNEIYKDMCSKFSNLNISEDQFEDSSLTYGRLFTHHFNFPVLHCCQTKAICRGIRNFVKQNNHCKKC